MPVPTAILTVSLTLAALWCVWRYLPVWRYNGAIIRLHQWPSWRLVYKNEQLRKAINAAMRLHGLARLEALTARLPGNADGMESWRLYTEIVATGLPEALPWVDQLLDGWTRGRQVLNGVDLALKRKLATEEFRIKVFQKLVPWLTANDSRCETLPETLLRLDSEWALRVLTDSEVLSPDSVIFKSVVEALHKHGVAFSTDQLRGWLNHLETVLEDSSNAQTYLEIVKVFMIHDQAEAEKRLWGIIRGKHEGPAWASAEFLLESHNQAMPRDQIQTQVEREGLPSLSAIHRTAWLADLGYVYPVIHCDPLAYYFEREEANRWPEVVAALRVVGANNHADLLQSVANLFGPAGPSLNRDERIQQLSELGSNFPDLVEKLAEGHPAGNEHVELLILIYLLENETAV